MISHKHDFLGNWINEGDYVVWAVRQGSSMWLNGGVVETVFEDKRLRVAPDKTEHWFAGSKRTVLLSANAHVVKVER